MNWDSVVEDHAVPLSQQEDTEVDLQPLPHHPEASALLVTLEKKRKSCSEQSMHPSKSPNSI
jgi:hypothetical protein